MTTQHVTQLRSESPRGIAVFGLLIGGAVLFMVVVVFQMLFTRNASTTRDLRRLTDMREAETLFQRLYRETGGYGAAAENGCAEQGGALAACNGSRINASFRHLVDPKDQSYRVTSVPNETTFTVTFHLERPHGNLAAGEHVLTQEGIR